LLRLPCGFLRAQSAQSFARKARGCGQHPAFPAPSLEEGMHRPKNPGFSSRGSENACVDIQRSSKGHSSAASVRFNTGGAARDLRARHGGIQSTDSEIRSARLGACVGCRLHEQWALPFAYRQQRALLSQFEFSAWQAQNESCLARVVRGPAHLASRCTTARWHHRHNAPELVLEFRMRLAIPAQEGDCCGATTGLVDLRHVGSRDRSRQTAA